MKRVRKALDQDESSKLATARSYMYSITETLIGRHAYGCDDDTCGAFSIIAGESLRSRLVFPINYGLMGIKCLACLALRIYNSNILVTTPLNEVRLVVIGF